jgi:hypothetical protein
MKLPRDLADRAIIKVLALDKRSCVDLVPT